MIRLETSNKKQLEQLRAIVPEQNPASGPLKAAKMLGYNGEGYGSEIDGKFYPEISQNDLVEALLPYADRIAGMKDPVVVRIPDIRQYSLDQLNWLNLTRQLDERPIEKDDLIKFPSPANLPESWTVGNSLKDRYAAAVDDRKMPLQGNYYQVPFPGWTVFVCERNLRPLEDNQYLEDLTKPDSPYVQLTPREAFMMQALELSELAPGEIEVLLGHYDGKNDEFPVMWCEEAESGSNRYKVGHMDASKTKLREFTEKSTGGKLTLQARQGFRLQTFSQVVKDYLQDGLKDSRGELREALGDLLGKEISLDMVTLESLRIGPNTPNISVALRAIKQELRRNRMAINGLLVAFARQQWEIEHEKSNGRESQLDLQLDQLYTELEQAQTRVHQQGEQIRHLRAENNRLKLANSRARATRQPSGFQITPENIRMMKTVALKKLAKALGLCFHPDVNEGRENKSYSRFRQLISEEIARRGVR